MQLGLALSGGGFRATLFHLGVVRYFKDAGLLESVSHITSVSGGSVFAAHLVMNWKRYNGTSEEFDSVAREVLDFIKLDVRNRIIRRYPFTFALGVLRRLARFGPLRTLSRTGLLEKHYREHLYGDTCLYELPDTPELHILSTNLSEGGLFCFSGKGMFCEERIKSAGGGLRKIPVGLATVPMAVAASSAFPGFFPPLELNAEDIGETESEFQRQYFTDGGVYDNLGARMFRYLESGAVSNDDDVPAPKFNAVFASDAGRRIQVSQPDKASSFLRTAMRASDILMDRVWQFEKEHFEGCEEFYFVPITRIISREEDPTAPHPKVQIQLSRVRTDLDSFDDVEMSGLIRHGYCVARQIIAEHPVLAGKSNDDPPWDPLAEGNGESIETKHRPGSSASATTHDARHLQRSTRRSNRSLLSWNDWVSYLYMPLILLIFFGIPFFVYNTWQQARFNHLLSEAMPLHVEKLADLLSNGSEPAWAGMDINSGDLAPLFKEKGLDLISDTRIIDLRGMESLGGHASEEEATVYVHRVIAVRKEAHVAGETALRLPSMRDITDPIVRCGNPALKPVLERCEITDAGDGDPKYAWQLKLNFDAVPVGHTTRVIVEAMWKTQLAASVHEPQEWSAFQVDADPEVTTAWILFPASWKDLALRLIRYPNGTPDDQEYVEATHESSIFKGTVFNWVEVHPKQGYTYAYQRDNF